MFGAGGFFFLLASNERLYSLPFSPVERLCSAFGENGREYLVLRHTFFLLFLKNFNYGK